jgi:hypothetical protein
MAPKVSEQIVQNMQKEGVFRIPKKDYNDEKARGALSLRFKEILTERTRKLVDMFAIFLLTMSPILLFTDDHSSEAAIETA